MEPRQDSLLSISRQSTGFSEEDTEELSTASLSALAANDDLDTVSRLSLRLLGYGAPPGVGAVVETPRILLASAMTAWQAHLSKLTSLENQMFMDHSKGDLIQYIKGIEGICQKQGDASKGRKIAKLFRPWFSTINQYAPIAQTMIQADPTSSALLLGGITCILSISERYLEFPEKILDLLADMGEEIDLLTEYGSDIYRNNDAVQVAIVEVFGDILQFCRLALPLFRGKDGKERSSAHSFLKALKTSFQGYFGDVLKKYETDLRIFEERAKLCDRREERDYRSVQADVSRYQLAQTMHVRADLMSVRQYHASTIASGRPFTSPQSDPMKIVEAILLKHEEEKEKEMLREKITAWLEQSSIKFHADQNKKMIDRLHETGTWIVKNDKYIKWKENSESELLWVNGKRGCGKSFLTSMVVQDLKALCESVENLNNGAEEKSAFAFIYCTSLETDKYDLSKLLCSLVEQLSHQLPRPGIDSYLEGIYERSKGSRPLDFDEIKRALESLLGRFKKTYLVIDGLDELRILKDDQFQEQCHFFRKLTQPRNDDSAVKLVAFSRPEYLVISNAFDGCPQVLIDDGANDEDIEKFISMKLKGIGLRFKQNPDVIKDIKQELLRRAEGMFLWVDLVTNSLKGERTAKGLRQKIVKDENVRDTALKILLWTTNARRPLRRTELLEALAVQPGMTELDEEDKVVDDTDFCGVCENLIVLDRTNECYQLLHSSLKDYLMERNVGKVDVPEEYRALQKNADNILGETCLTYLNFEQFGKDSTSSAEDVKRMIAASPFLQYAAVQWGRHVAVAKGDHLHDLARTFVTVSERRNLSMQFLILAHEERPTLFAGPSTPLHILAMFDLVGVASTMTDLDAYQAQADGFSAIPLDYALSYGSRQMCNRLLVGIENLNESEDRPRCRCLPIHTAANNGWAEVVRSLIDLGYEAEIKSGNEGLTAFHIAAIQGSTNVLEVLLEKGINKDAVDVDGSTPLLRACEVNNSSFAKKLIEAGANVILPGWNGTTPLHHTAKNGELELVEMLLQRGANKNATCSESWGYSTPLFLAAEEDAFQVLQHLIDEGVDVDTIGPDGFTALHVSSDRGYLKCLDALLKAGAAVDLKTEDGQNAIHLAAWNGHLDVLKLLFDRRAEQCANIIDDPKNDNHVALHDAAYNGHLKTVQFLIEKGALCNTSSTSKTSPIHEAIVRGNTDIARWFLENDPTSVTWKGALGSSTLHYVATYGADYPSLNDLIIPLLEAKAEPEAANDVGRRAIHFAIKAGNLQFADILLEQVPNLELNALSKRLKTPLYSAAAVGISESVEWLLDKKVPLEQPKTDDDNSPMQISAWNGHFNVLKMLLTPENVNEPGFKGRTALFGASARGHYDIAKYLLENNADPNIKDEFGETPLICSIETEHIKIANLLLDSEADPNIATTNGLVAFHKACLAGDEALVHRLLKANCDPLDRDRYGQTPFMYSLTCTNPGVLNILVEEKIDGWYVPDYSGATCLHALASFGSVGRLEGCKDFFNTEDFKAVDEIGRNALWYAAKNGHADIFEALLALGVPIRGADDSPRGPLHDAAYGGFIDAVQELIKLRHNIIPIDEHQRLDDVTALHAAVSSQRPVTAGILVQAGANPLLRDTLGLTALDYAIRHPRPWRDTAFSKAGYKHTELTFRMPRLKATAQKMLQKILNLPDKLASQDEYYRRASLHLLASALLEMDTKESVERAIVCYFELVKPVESAGYYSTWTCEICGKESSGPGYSCSQSCFAILLCDLCYPEYEKGDGSPKNVPRSVKTLEELQKQLEPVRQALAPYITIGSRFIIGVLNSLELSKLFLDEKQKEFEEWTKSFNTYDRFNGHRLTGLNFLEWLQKATKVVAEREEEEAKDETADKSSSGDADGGSELNLTESELGRTTEEKGEREEDPLEILDRELFISFKDNRPDKELWTFPCDNHEFLEIPTMETASEELKKCFGEDGRITKDWLRELGEWFDKIPIQAEVEKPAKYDQDNEQSFVAVPESDAATDLNASDLNVSGSPPLPAPTEQAKPIAEYITADTMAVTKNERDREGSIGSDEKARYEKAGDEEADINEEDSIKKKKKIALLTRIQEILLINVIAMLRIVSGSHAQSQYVDELGAEPEEIRGQEKDQNVAETELLSPEATSGSTIGSSGYSEAIVTAADNDESQKSTADRKEISDAIEVVFADETVRIWLAYEATWRVAQAILLGKINQRTLQEILEGDNSDDSTSDEDVEKATEEEKNNGGEINDSAIGSSKSDGGIVDDSATDGMKVKDGNTDSSAHNVPAPLEDQENEPLKDDTEVQN